MPPDKIDENDKRKVELTAQPETTHCDASFTLRPNFYHLAVKGGASKTKYKTLPLSFYGFGSSTSCASSPANDASEVKSFAAEESSQDSGIGTDFSAPVQTTTASVAVFGDRTNLIEKFLSTGTLDKLVFRRTLSMPAPADQAKAAECSVSRSSPRHGRFCCAQSTLLSPVPDDADDGFAELNDFSNELDTSLPSKSCAADKNSTALACRKRRRELTDNIENKVISHDQKTALPTAATSPSCFIGHETPTSAKQSAKRAKECTDFVNLHSATSPSLFGSRNRAKQRLVRCHSEAVIHMALSMSDEHSDLIGDFSRPYSLPLLSCAKHQDLKSIDAETMAQVLNNEISAHAECVVIDCRYPYEYEAGHIQGAKNVYTKEGIVEEFLTKGKNMTKNCDTIIIVFHCEFSSERGPKLMRFLRNKDRDGHRDCYPMLLYPECYLLEGGYRAFFEAHPELCQPRGYRSMIDPQHAAALKHFRSKSRSWPAPTNEEAARQRRSRSCLKL